MLILYKLAAPTNKYETLDQIKAFRQTFRLPQDFKLSPSTYPEFMRYYSEYAQTWTRAYSIYESIVDPALMLPYKTCEQDKSLNMSRIFIDPIDKHAAGPMIARGINTELTRSNCRDVPRMLQLANQVVNEKAEVMRRGIEATVLTFLTLERGKSTTDSRDSSHTRDHTGYQKRHDSFPTARNSGRNDRPAAGGGSASHPSRPPFRRPGDKLMAMRDGDDTDEQSVPRAPRDWANDEEWEDLEEDKPLDQEELEDFRQMADRNRNEYDDAYEPGQDDSYQPRAGDHWQEHAQQASEEYASPADAHCDNSTEQLLFAMHDTPAGEEPSRSPFRASMIWASNTMHTHRMVVWLFLGCQ